MSMVLQVLTGVTDITSLINLPTLTFSSSANGVGVCYFTYEDMTGVYLPSQGDAIEIKLDTVTRWKGNVSNIEATFAAYNTGLKVSVTAQDYNILPKNAEVTAYFDTQTLKQILQYLVGTGGPFNSMGITLHASQATGPTIDAFLAEKWTGDSLLAALSTATGYVWYINSSKQLRMWEIADPTFDTGVTISLAAGNLLDVKWGQKIFDYRNVQNVIYGPDGSGTPTYVSDTWSGDGTTRIWPLHYNKQGPIYPVIYSGIYHPVGTYGTDDMEWTYDSVGHTVRQRLTDTPVGNGIPVTANYYTLYPNTVQYKDTVEIAANGGIEVVKTDRAEAITLYADALALATNLIDRNKSILKIPIITTSEETALPAGWTLTVTLPVISLSSSCFIQTIETTCEDAGEEVQLASTINLIGGTMLQQSIADLWKIMISGSNSGTSSVSSSGNVTTNPTIGGGGGSYYLGGSRFHAVQVPE